MTLPTAEHRWVKCPFSRREATNWFPRPLTSHEDCFDNGEVLWAVRYTKKRSGLKRLHTSATVFSCPRYKKGIGHNSLAGLGGSYTSHFRTLSPFMRAFEVGNRSQAFASTSNREGRQKAHVLLLEGGSRQKLVTMLQ